jgi:hypothetical protein
VFCTRNFKSMRLELVVIDLDPISVRILQVDLLYLVRPDLRGLGGLRPIAIFYIGRIKVFGEGGHIRHAESQVYIYIMGDILLGTGDHMQLPVLRKPEPYVLSVMKRLGDTLEFHYALIKIRRTVQIGHIDGLMAELRALGAAGKRQHQWRDHNKQKAAKAWQDQSIHGSHFLWRLK